MFDIFQSYFEPEPTTVTFVINLIAAIGMVIGFGYLQIAVIAALASVLIPHIPHVNHFKHQAADTPAPAAKPAPTVQESAAAAEQRNATAAATGGDD